MQEIDRVTNVEAIITTDVGQHQMWAAQYYHYTKPRTFLSSGGLGTMGCLLYTSILLPVDSEYDMIFFEENSLYQCFARIIDRYKSNNVYVLVMELTSNCLLYTSRCV